MIYLIFSPDEFSGIILNNIKVLIKLMYFFQVLFIKCKYLDILHVYVYTYLVFPIKYDINLQFFSNLLKLKKSPMIVTTHGLYRYISALRNK